MASVAAREALRWGGGWPRARRGPARWPGAKDLRAPSKDSLLGPIRRPGAKGSERGCVEAPGAKGAPGSSLRSPRVAPAQRAPGQPQVGALLSGPLPDSAGRVDLERACFRMLQDLHRLHGARAPAGEDGAGGG